MRNLSRATVAILGAAGIALFVTPASAQMAKPVATPAAKYKTTVVKKQRPSCQPTVIHRSTRYVK